MNDKADVIVLGAGIVGVSVALHLQMRGRRTILVDRHEPGRAASYGNAGIIQSEAIMPYLFPRQLRELLRYARNQSTDAFYHLAALPKLTKPFLRYWRNSHPDNARAIAQSRAPLVRRSVADHIELATAAGALDLLRHSGWTQVFRTPRVFESALAGIEKVGRAFDMPFCPLDGPALAGHEPYLRPGLAGGVHWPQPVTVVDPHALTMAYIAHFVRLGGEVHIADARALQAVAGGWQIPLAGRVIAAPEIVVAMGMSSLSVTEKLGYFPPLFAKRGYHMHYAMSGEALLNRPILDAESGYALAPMRAGLRLTTGAEFASPDALPSPVQLQRAEPVARALVPAMGRALDPEPWMGCRPCLPDMLPIIGPAPGRPGAWFALGHAHHGLTLGPTTGRLLAQMMTGMEPFTDPAPYRAERFG